MTGVELCARFPQEIWADIFLECLPSQQYVCPDSSCAPLLLCQVNRAWRSTALSLSTLWSSLSLEVPEQRGTEGLAEGANTWLGRSGMQPLALSLRIRDADKLAAMAREPEVNMDAILDLFVSYIERWEIVRIDLASQPRGSIENIHQFHAPILKRFDVRFYFWTTKVIEPLFSMLSTAPRLVDFVWHNDDKLVYRPQFHIAEPRIPWPQLTRLKIVHDMTVSECLTVLRLCPNLLDCTFTCLVKVHQSELVLHDASIVHLQLHSLSVGFQYAFTLQFLDHITLPALSSLALQSAAGDDLPDIQLPQSSFMAFLSRSRCTLKTFKVQTAILSNQPLIASFRLLPTLTELSIEGDLVDSLDDILIGSLMYNTQDEDEEYLCPRLQAITLSGHITSSHGRLVEMLQSRCRSELYQEPQISCLRRLTVLLTGTSRNVWTEYLQEVAVLQDTGLDIVVDWEYPRRFGVA